jgi:hypothetical protein
VKFNVVVGDNIGIVRKESAYRGKFNVVGGDNIGIMRTEIAY